MKLFVTLLVITFSSTSFAQENKGFESTSSGFESDGKKVKKLIDDKGSGEYIPKIMVELSAGITGISELSVKNGPSLNAGGFYQIIRDIWLGASFNFSYFFGEDAWERITDFGFDVQGRYYFMPHREANRFVMSWLSLGLGYSILNASGTTGNDVSMDTSTSAFDISLGIGVAKALSPKNYIGFSFTYVFPVWNDICIKRGSTDEVCESASTVDFESTFWRFSLVWSYRF
ncbi:MAG: hypothetical protein JXR95_09400 [Deltaproteobacteria bacterium]|nr:hypothetical protein [Deltaproteobacteria bacterium]